MEPQPTAAWFGELLNSCKALISGLRNAYSYVPNLIAGIACSVLFPILFIDHLVRSIQKRHWTSYLLAASALIELTGWVGRAWSAKCPCNKTAFLMQITTLVLASIFVTAGIYVRLGHLIKEVGPRFSLVNPKLYRWIFCIADVVSLLIQAGGAALASTATNHGKDPTPGARMMVSGMIFQLVCVTLLTVPFAVFIWRTRRVDLARGQNLVIYARRISVTAVFIRCVFRKIELLQGWNEHLMETEGLFIDLDAVCIVVAIAIYSVFDPAVLMPGEEQVVDAQQQRELRDGLMLENDKRTGYQYDNTVPRGGGCCGPI